ncbi:uncharacterized protein LOC115628406 [Scaptodrosophila lebanonensis]|uniref:Uncharacterized protein LOC115628406 n=1 Tax=Drosophila lebanonensis TaxID=7225 RepID=A0A6J2TXQ2_DROLE|nr:uncharacterized protein LOC115628406 [Scaptodrosophila lebanonensis]
MGNASKKMSKFLTKRSSAPRTLLVLLLALCCLSSAFGAKITKKTEKQTQNNSEDKAQVAAAVEEAEAEQAADEDDNDGDDDDDDDDEEADKEAAAATATTTTTSATGDKNAVQPADPTDLSVWGMVRTLWSWLRSDLSESLFGDDDDKPTSAVEGRTFGKIRRLQMALIPIIFKFGVLSAMVAFLVAIGMKSLFLLKVLVVMNAVAILGKFLTLKTTLFGQYEHSAPTFSYPGWNPHAKESWAPTGPAQQSPHTPSKEIHLHIHGNTNGQIAANQGYTYDTQGWQSRSDPYGAYMPTGNTGTQYLDAQSELPNNTDPMSLLPTKYPARQLIR